MDEVTWQALALVLTAGSGAWTWYAFRNRGLASGLRGAGVTLLPVAAYLTGTLELGAEVTSSVVDWATGLVFSPAVWTGVVLFGVAMLLFFIAGALAARGKGGATPRKARTAQKAEQRAPGQLGAAAPSADGPIVDDEFADIEALLKKRGIT